MIKKGISICFPTIRPYLWAKLYKSLESNTIDWEIVCGGPGDWNNQIPGDKFKFFKTNVKPSQVYECCFRQAQYELLHWSTDDCTYSPNALDNAYQCYKETNTEKVVITMRPVEDGREITNHTFKGGDTPAMAPFGVMSTRLFHELGGYDRRFICGQAENDIVMKVYEIGGINVISQGSIVYVFHNQGHNGLSVFRGGVEGKPGYYGEDRKVLEPLWINEEGMRKLTGIKSSDDQVVWSNFISKTRRQPVERYEGTIEELIAKTQGQLGCWQ